MQALILAGGQGTRLRPLTLTTPKPVLPLVNRPFLNYMIEWLAGHGVSKAVISLGFLADGVAEILGTNQHGVELEYVIEPQPLGTAGAIKFAESLLEERFLVLNGDVLTDIDLTKLIELSDKNDANAAISLTPVDDPSNYGLVRTRTNGEVVEFLEKPSSDEIDTDKINAGAYLLKRDVLGLIPGGQEVSIEREVFPRMIGEGLFAFPDKSYWLDIGTPERYLQATFDILSGRFQVGGSLTKDSARDIEGGRSPISVSGELILADSATVGPYVSVGNRCSIGSVTVVERASIADRCSVGSNCVIRDSIVGPGVTIGDGVVVEETTVIGANATVASGCKLSAGARVDPGSALSADCVFGEVG